MSSATDSGMNVMITVGGAEKTRRVGRREERSRKRGKGGKTGLERQRNR